MERSVNSPAAKEHDRGQNIPSSMLRPTLPSRRSSSSQRVVAAQTACHGPRSRSADRSPNMDGLPQQMPQIQSQNLPHAIMTTPGVLSSLSPSQGTSSPFISEDKLASTPTRMPTSTSGHNHLPLRENLTKRQHLAFRSCTFVLLRILLFPKIVFVKGLSFGRGLLDCLRLTRTRRSSHLHRQRRHHFRSYQRSSSIQGCRHERSGSSHHTGDLPYPPTYHRRRRRHSNARSRTRHGSSSEAATPLESPLAVDKSNGCGRELLTGYNAQVAMICLCLIGESFAQSVMCPFLYYMVRDFHVGKDMWIGYYAGLLWTGFWSANLVTTMLWGHLSDKYGRKVVMIFGLFMTSISTLCLGLSTCYHDAMMALVVQGACTSLIPVSKCSIGEIANRQQKLHDAQIALSQRRSRQQQRSTQGPSLVEDMDLRDISETPMDEKISTGLHGEAKIGCEDDGPCSDPECCGSETDSEASMAEAMASPPKIDFASKGYSALVIALAIGAALGPLAGGNLTNKQVPGFESYPYFAPCMLASSVGFVLTGIVAFGLTESHPKWAKPTEVERAIEEDAHECDVSCQSFTPLKRGRTGYEMAINHRESSTNISTPAISLTSVREIMEMPAALCVDDTRGSAESQPCEMRSGIQEIQPAPSACTCAIAPDPTTMSSEGDESLALSPATELSLVLTIYTLLVLTSILGSEFVMLYTQSSSIRGGLQYSAKIFGQVLTLRGIIKLVFNLFGYPWMVARIGLLKCLRLGIFIIGFTSVFGLGLLVPWNVYKEDTSTWEQMQDIERTGSGSGPGFEIEDGRSAGVGTVLLCLSLISMGDVLGYISVLVLFGKSAERLKGVYIKNGAIMLGDSADEQAQPSTTRGGSGVLWSVAQASANVMRLAGPVLAGLLWSLNNKQRDMQSASSTFHHAPSEPGNSAFVSNSQLLSQSSFKVPGQMDEGAAARSVLERWPSLTFAMDILQGSTNVFYLVGAICVLNFIACQFLVASKRLWSHTAVPMRQCPLHMSYTHA